MIKQSEIINIINTNYSLRIKKIKQLKRGYTNQCFLIKSKLDYILRISWSGKPIEQVEKEENILTFLAQSNSNLPVPRLVPTNTGEYRCVSHLDRKVQLIHLYHKLPGKVKYQWYDNCQDQDLFGILTLLNKLHLEIEHLKAPIYDPTYFLREKIKAVDPQNLNLKRNLMNIGITELSSFLEQSNNIVNHADRLLQSTSNMMQWIHADMQLENILFENNKISGIVDFDNVKYSLKELDIMFALLSICRFSRSDEKFQYNKKQLLKGLKFYKKITNKLNNDVLNKHNIDVWLALFCLDQSLMHLLCAQNNVWELIPETGFMASFKEVLNYGQK